MIDWLALWRDIAIVLAWIVVVIFIISGAEDLIYDIGLYCWKIIKRLRFRSRPRLTLNKLRSRVQQRIAVFVPTWEEANVIGLMVENLIKTVEYRNFYIFIGTYPNDLETIRAIDQIAAKHPNVVKIINAHLGPTTKADCLNAIYQYMREYETTNKIDFDIVVMHDAEDVVHPYSLLLYNYLLPRVDAIQIPILPLPISHSKLVHWSYADEFAENHMKDMIVREHIKGLVPFAGVGTGFSRRAFLMLEKQNQGKMFNSSSLTEDYSFGNTINKAGLKSIFVNVVLDDEKPKSIFTPLYRRSGFIANWSYFPQNFSRAIRQKTRWVFGISIQEWEFSGWKGNAYIKLSLFKDRKTFLTLIAALVAYIVLIYVIISELGARGYISLQLHPIIFKGTLLYTLVLIATVIMLIRIIERFVFVTAIYGVIAGLLSIPRLIFNNFLNGIATFNAFIQYVAIRLHRKEVLWDKTEHREGVGVMPSNATTYISMVKSRHTETKTDENLFEAIKKWDSKKIIEIIESLPQDASGIDQEKTIAALYRLAESEDYTMRASVSKVVGYLNWAVLHPIAINLLYDKEWVVRANAAKSLLRFPDLEATLNKISKKEDEYAWEIFIKVLEQDTSAHDQITKLLNCDGLEPSIKKMFEKSVLLSGLVV